MRNLTELSLKHTSLVIYFVIAIVVGGIFSYVKLGRMEDPTFTIREMIVTAYWPGASAEEVERQVTDKLEKQLQNVPHLDYIKSYTIAGRTYIHVALDQSMPTEDVRPTWRDVRNFCEDVRHELPDGVVGPFYNDRFDDVYGNIYALTGDGYSYEELREEAEKIRRQIVQVGDVQKVVLIGEQKEKVYVEIERSKIETMGLSPSSLVEMLAAERTMLPAGAIDTETDDVYLRVTGDFADAAHLRSMPINVSGKVYRLGDVAHVERRAVEPSDPKMYYNGVPAIGIAVSMTPGGNILRLGEHLDAVVADVRGELSAGLAIHQVSSQPEVVEASIDDFVDTLREAIIIVLLVSFLSLGWRTGMVVAVCIPLVLLATFLFMYIGGIDLHKVSLGALIISLGLLVDDEIIAVEMMSVKLEEGLSRFDAACHAFRATAMPMLTGTLVTCAGFIPVAFSKGMAAEFCSALFPVIGIALLVSWIVSVMVAPLLGYHIIRTKTITRGEADDVGLYQGRFYAFFRRVLDAFLAHHRMAICGTIALFALSLYAMQFVPKNFFPPSLRPEILVEMQLSDGASLRAMDDEVKRFSDFLHTKAELFTNYAAYVGTGAPRFVLTVDPHLPANNFAEIVLVANDIASRKRLADAIEEEIRENFPTLQATIRYVQTGPPAEYPVMFRISGPETEMAREIALEVRRIVEADADAYGATLDWDEKSKVLRVDLDEAKLRSLGTSVSQVKKQLYANITGMKAGQLYSKDRTIDIEIRMPDAERDALSAVGDLPIYLHSRAGYVPLRQIAKLSYEAEHGVIWRRNLLPTFTVGAEVADGTDGMAVSARIYHALERLQETLPAGYRVEPAGAMEESEKSMDYLLVPIPLMVFVLMTLLMFQLRKIKLMLITIMTAPLGLIGVAWGMLISGEAMGFVAQLGFLALAGMIIRNTVILIDQIEKHREAGETLYAAVTNSAVLRFRPIMLTAAAAILGMLPLMANPFWAPMAVTIAGGLFVATILTLLILPAMYVAVYQVKEE